MRDKGMLFENDGKLPKLRLKEDIVAYVNMPEKREKGLPFLSHGYASHVRLVIVIVSFA
jgi:hypothetical protein